MGVDEASWDSSPVEDPPPLVEDPILPVGSPVSLREVIGIVVTASESRHSANLPDTVVNATRMMLRTLMRTQKIS